jgi:hypothetical protein
MASYHLSVKTIKRSAGRTATAAAAYRAGERIECQREGRLHDYTRKSGIEETFIVAPETAPSWAQDRAALWNAAEESETRRNAVTAREWELSLPSEISAEDRLQITRDFAEQLVSRYGVAVDVAIHAPNREGDQRNHHAHVLTTTRQLEPDGFTAKIRVLDSAKTGGAEIDQMRGFWAELQNRALERAGEVERVDHRSLEKQREAAHARGDEVKAEELDRDPELKLGPAANSMERREKAAAERDGREYVPVTERGAVVHAARQARMVFQEMRERLDVAREVYGMARDEGQGRVSAGLAALRAATTKDRSAERNPQDVRERLARITEREDAPEPQGGGRNYARERLKSILERDAAQGPQVAVHKLDGHSALEQDEGAGGPSRASTHRQGGDRGDDNDLEKDGDETENTREVDRGRGHSL